MRNDKNKNKKRVIGNLDSVSIEGEKKMNKIKFRRGSLNNKKNIDIEDGEPIYLTDTKRLYVSNEDVAINNVYVGSQEPNDPGINVWINPQGINNVVDMIYPIGSIYISVNNANPSAVFGGSWESFGTGKTLVGVDTSQTEFNTVEKTGGSKNHNHTLNDGYAKISAWGGQGGGIAMESSNKTSIINTTAGWSLGSPSTSQYGNTVTALGGNTDSTTNLQPYITCYMWKRIG